MAADTPSPSGPANDCDGGPPTRKWGPIRGMRRGLRAAYRFATLGFGRPKRLGRRRGRGVPPPLASLSAAMLEMPEDADNYADRYVWFRGLGKVLLRISHGHPESAKALARCAISYAE